MTEREQSALWAGPACWIVVSSLLFATMSALVKMVAADISLAEIVFFRNLPSAIGLFAFANLRGLSVRTPHWRLHAQRSTVGVVGMTLAFYAVTKLPLATATTLEYTAPLFIILGTILLGRRRVSLVEVLAVAIGFLGVLLLLQPTVREGQAVPFVLGLTTGICAAIAYRTVWQLGRVGEPGWRIVLYYSLTAVVSAALAMPFAGSSSYTPQSVATLVGIGAIGLISQLTMTQAFRVGSTARLATLQYTTVLFSASYGVVFWGDRISAAMGAGLVLIVISGIVAANRVTATPGQKHGHFVK